MKTINTFIKGAAVSLCVCTAAISTSLMADSHGDGTLSDITETSRTVKTGGGTLVLSGNNSLVGLEVSAGTLKINGGTTTIEGPGGAASSISTFGQSGPVGRRRLPVAISWSRMERFSRLPILLALARSSSTQSAFLRTVLDAG